MSSSPAVVRSGWVPSIATAVMAVCALGRADEGMWLFTAPPRDRLVRDHGFELGQQWLDRLRAASVRFNTGGSGSFVSGAGLVVTNHHVVAETLQKLGTPGHDIHRDGFLAGSQAAELACPDLELTVLESIEDVTARVEAAVPPDVPPAEAFARRRAVMAEIERESLAATGLKSDVVTLHRGGAHHLHRARRYTDVRLVFAPEHAVAFFGGDVDNFEFPRYALDVCFLRVYHDGRPVHPAAHLEWRRLPVVTGELVFVTGHPGHTDRGKTVAELIALRDDVIPRQLRDLARLETLYATYVERGPEERRQATASLDGVRNGLKARAGVLAGLLDPGVMRRKRLEESAWRRLVGPRDPDPFDRIAEAERAIASVAERHALLEAATAFNTHFFTSARLLQRYAAEGGKPDGDRLREFRDSNRASVEQRLFSSRPLDDAFETAKLADSLTCLATTLGADDPLVQAVLAGLSPRRRAAELVAATRLGRRSGDGGRPEADIRRALFDGGAAAVAAADDPMLELARIVDQEARRTRAVVEAAREAQQQAHAEIARARFEAHGDALYPDATFTLRLAYGTVRGVPPDGPATTTFGGLVERAEQHGDQPPFALPPRWQRLRDDVLADAAFRATQLNFASTADIIGGNSGSPVVDRDGRLVGVIFDGNAESLLLDVVYDDLRARAVSVAASGILAALGRVYQAESLVSELLGRDAAAPPASAAP